VDAESDLKKSFSIGVISGKKSALLSWWMCESSKKSNCGLQFAGGSSGAAERSSLDWRAWEDCLNDF
ncbi:MAG: hypothetical protein ACK6D4_03530, partial [Planctomyces sp.]